MTQPDDRPMYRLEFASTHCPGGCYVFIPEPRTLMGRFYSRFHAPKEWFWKGIGR